MSKLRKQMRKKMAKLFKKVEWGDHDALMEGIELLIDTKDNNPYENGYRACMMDLAVRSQRLAEHIYNAPPELTKLGKDANGEPLAYYESSDDLAKVIENYFLEALKTEE